MEINRFYVIYPKTNCSSLDAAMRRVEAGDENVKIEFVLEEVFGRQDRFGFGLDRQIVSTNETLEEAFMNFKMCDPDSICLLSYSLYALNPMDILFQGKDCLDRFQEMSVSSIQDFGYPVDSIVRLI